MCNHHLPGMVAALVEAERRTRTADRTEAGFLEGDEENRLHEPVAEARPVATEAKS
ncbi:hypothetical protein SAMN05421630_101743 [Prauserella marina]|uniref:Uncharacterized protein n=1 Tax=Prauserella marina TaxID=530584 RepID=A0A1G6JJ46_9PSEU|nr:hypothetical protein [Prauserella marina]PWV84576.1 hypothetical protein DES30_101593 [Prauserella marina]SDC18754.1 hypothetical protein SAMN05421630_101743 [Prauserella marina]